MLFLLLSCLCVLLAACAVMMLKPRHQMDPVVIPSAMSEAPKGVLKALSPSARYVGCGDQVWRAEGYTGEVRPLGPGETQRSDAEGVMFSSWPEQYIPAHIDPQIKEHRRHRIPANLFMSFYTSQVRGPFYRAVANSVSKHPNYTFRFYDDVACRRMIAEHLEPEVLAAYDALVPGAYKCDLWRLCVLYLYGGVYMDMRYGACVNVDTLLDEDTDYFVVNDVQVGHVHNALMACVPKHPIMRRYIDRVVKMVSERSYGKSPLHITGPGILGEVLFEHFPALNWRIPERITHPELGNLRSINFNLAEFVHQTHDGRRVGVVKMPGCSDNASFYKSTNKKDYTFLWKRGGVYADKKAAPK